MLYLCIVLEIKQNNNKNEKKMKTQKMKDEKKYEFIDNWSGENHQFASLKEAKQAAKQLTFGFSIYIYREGDIVAIVEANDKPLP